MKIEFLFSQISDEFRAKEFVKIWIVCIFLFLDSLSLSIQISSSLSCRDHIFHIAKLASQELGVLFQCKWYFNSTQSFRCYTGFAHPSLEYFSHIWGTSPSTSFVDTVGIKGYLFDWWSLLDLNSWPSISSPQGCFSIFFYHYYWYFGHCSNELAACIPPSATCHTLGIIRPQLFFGTFPCKN